MANAVRFYEAGGPEVLRYEQVSVGDPGPGEVRVRHVAVGLNFADTYFRLGYYPVPIPNGMGVEASGVIEAVGPGVTGFKVGDRVTYTGSPLGAYSTERVMPVPSLFKLPDGISHEVAAASTMRGLSAAYWLLKTNPWMKAGDTVLLHAAAGGVGLIAVQWAKLLGLRVIGTVSTEEKAELAKGYGCDEIIYYRRENVAERVMELTGGKGVTTVYDTVGKDTFESSLKSLKRRGVLVGCGTASGPFPPIDALQMAIQGSVYFTRPALADYVADPAERKELSDALFGHVASGRIKIEINQRYALEDAQQAHRDLEAGKTTGSSIFTF
ncbi:quinone oxidoreductase [Sphingomonas sp. NSE70-1]|uniref:Quinone oxidoreductase n=1 Tax=Sphingomonas caseinilyticus TaxID=2908205 RepID=A0ABT0RT98_9SPHN|nr:quinone oxidoreductase [Sphingomonas caseinilyticus]MCL6698240.1 quinone oxidoreductase [Sphingomonas caseinilyticus]